MWNNIFMTIDPHNKSNLNDQNKELYLMFVLRVFSAAVWNAQN